MLRMNNTQKKSVLYLIYILQKNVCEMHFIVANSRSVWESLLMLNNLTCELFDNCKYAPTILTHIDFQRNKLDDDIMRLIN